MNMSRGVWLFALMAGPLACGDGYDEGATAKGELGDGVFRYVCAGNSDSFCPDGVTASSFPQALAVGGQFSLKYEPKGGGALPQVEPASRSALSKELDVFTLHQPGYVAVFAQDAFGDVIDLLHLNGRHVAGITVALDGMEQSTLRLGAGERLDIVAQPRDQFQTLLAGSLRYVWGSDDPSVFVVASDTDDDDVTLEGVSPGTAVLHIEAGGHTHTIQVEVGPGGDTTTTGDTDTGETETGEDSTGGGSSDDTTGTTGETDTTGDTGETRGD